MALSASMRRDQRRRLLASRQRDPAGVDEAASGAAGPGAVTPYDDEAHPERHPAIATRLPVATSRFVATALGILVATGVAIAVAVSGPLFGRPLLAGSGRFARTLGVIASAFDPQAGMSVQIWLAELALLAAAVVAGSVRFMRRHRRDDFKGRFRAWGWLASLLGVAAFAGAVPLGPLVASLLSDVTGIAPGPDGIGWWLGAAAVAFGVVLPWAVLPLRERRATLAWTLVAMASWSVAAAVPWATATPAAAGWFGGEVRGMVVSQAAWVAGSAFLLVAMLAAARSVIREVRGQCAAPVARRPKRKGAAVPTAADETDGRDEQAIDQSAADGDEADEYQPDEESEAGDDRGDHDFVDGSDAGNRRLSKAERKRLRKLARMNGYAA
jgi:MFS family permease